MGASPIGLVEVTAADRAAATVLGASADAGFRACGHEAVDGARLAAFRSPPPPLRPPLISLYHTKRWQVAAALSAAVTTTKPIGERTPLSGGTNYVEVTLSLIHI